MQTDPNPVQTATLCPICATAGDKVAVTGEVCPICGYDTVHITTSKARILKAAAHLTAHERQEIAAELLDRPVDLLRAWLVRGGRG